MDGGYTTRTVRASSLAEARRAAIAEAKRDLEKVAKWPEGECLRWSVDAIEEGKTQGGKEPEAFSFYRRPDEFLSASLEQLSKSLSRNDLYLSVAKGSISVIGEDEETHTVEIRDEDGTTVYAAHWHHHYDDPEQAVACFRWLLTPYYRVAHETQDGELSVAWIERYESTGWQPMDSMIFRNPTDPTQWMGGEWKREYRQQAQLRPPQPYTELFPEAWLDENDLPRGSRLGASTEIHPQSIAAERGWLEPDRLP
ncbi:hypothetical protein EON82_23290 [bacterium]|nr:MAG: hypothetical protein EON82_23290 [bacterium]